ncbi:MAG: DNA-3-methyladenine glycosylase [Candidatus Paceibacterota bacterium]
MKKILKKDFFERDAFEVAEELLGKYLVRRHRGKEISLKINEVEVYDGHEDRASKASRGKTEANSPMFGEAGRFYVYLTYGMYWMLNIVTSDKGYPSAVLIRGAGEIDGPGKLTRDLKINKSFNNKKSLPENNLWFEDKGEKVAKNEITKTSRVGIDRSGPEWSKKPFRFLLND